MNATEVFTIVLLVSASALCIALIFYLNKIVKSVQSINNNIKDLSANIKPLIKTSIELSDNLNKMTSSATEQLNISKSIVSDFRERADKLLSIEYKIRSGVEDAFMPLVKNLNAVGKGVESFWRNFKNK
jgi:archaellum component FlaC